jgi:hypothetical protein
MENDNKTKTGQTIGGGNERVLELERDISDEKMINRSLERKVELLQEKIQEER